MLEPFDVGLRNVWILEIWTKPAARRVVQDHKKDQRDQDQQRDRLERPPDDVIKQGPSPPLMSPR